MLCQWIVWRNIVILNFFDTVKKITDCCNWKQKPGGWGENAIGRAQLQNGKQDHSKHLAPNQKMEKGEQDAVLEVVLPYFSRIGC